MYKQLGRRFWGYTYEEMEKDLEIFARAFPETMELRTLGKTADKREIYCFILGRAGRRRKDISVWRHSRKRIHDQPASYGTDRRISYKAVPGRNL